MEHALSSPKTLTQRTISAFGDLPTELLETIFGYVDNLTGLRATCLQFKSIVGTRAFESIALDLHRRHVLHPLADPLREAVISNIPLVDIVRGLHVVFLDRPRRFHYRDIPFPAINTSASAMRLQLKKLDNLRLTFAADSFQAHRYLFSKGQPIRIRALTIDLHLFTTQFEWDLDQFSIMNIVSFLEELSVILYYARLHRLTSLLTRLFQHATELQKVRLEYQPPGTAISAPYHLISQIGSNMRELQLVGFGSHRAWFWKPGDKHVNLCSLHLVDPSPDAWDTTSGDDEDPALMDSELVPIPQADGRIRLQNLTLQVKWIPATVLKYLASYDGLEHLELQDHNNDPSRRPVSVEDGMAGWTPRQFLYFDVLKCHTQTLRVLRLGCRNRTFPTRWYFGVSSVHSDFDADVDVEAMCGSLRACVALEELRVSVYALDGLELLLRTVVSPMKLVKLEVTVIPTRDDQTTWPRIAQRFRTFGPIQYGTYRRTLEVFCDRVSLDPDPTIIFVLDDFQGGMRFVPLHDMQGKEVEEGGNFRDPKKGKSRGRMRRILSMFS